MKFWTVDAFTNQMFKGNPTAVCIVNSFPRKDLMKKVAMEMNLSKTIFVSEKPNAHYDVCWFTPFAEVDLCGHATLAAAHVLWNEYEVSDNPIYFDSPSGVFMAEKNGQEITLNFPAYSHEPMAVPDRLTDALGGISPVCVSRSYDDCIVELHRFSDVVALKPNLARLQEIDCRGVIVTADGKQDGRYDFVSRFFSPREGIAEDPVAGSAHCKLAPYWAERLGKNNFLAWQASKRGGILKLRCEQGRVYLTGEAVTVLRGLFLGKI